MTQQVTPDKARGYTLPEPIVLPDFTDEAVFREYRKRAELCARETRRTRRRYWLHQLFPWL